MTALTKMRILFIFALSVFIVSHGFSQKVNRVISLAPSITENIYLVGAQEKLVGCTSYCTQAVAEGVEQIGSTIDVNVEKVLSLKPDLVLTMLMTKTQDIEAMRKLGIRVEVIPSPKNFDEICEQTIHIASLLGKKEKAEKLIVDIKNQVDSLKQISLQNKRQKIFFQLGSNPVFTVLPDTFMDDYIIYCNGENIASDLTKGTMTRESVLVRNPDVIIIATMGGFGKAEMEVWKSYNGLNAAETGKIFLIDSETSCSPTPDNFLKAFSDIVTNLKQ